MTQYLLSVHMSESDVRDPARGMEKIYADVDAFNAEVKSSGAWVFAGGLHAADTATVVDATGRRRHRHRRPLRRDQGADRRLLGHRGRRPRRRPRVGEEGLGGMRRAGRGPPVPGRAARRVTADIACTFREESGRAVATLIRIFGDIDVAEDAVQEAFAIAVERSGRRRAGRRTPGRGSSRRRATGPSIGCAARRSAMSGTSRRTVLHPADELPPRSGP